VWAWGSNEYGEIGNNQDYSRYNPGLSPEKNNGLPNIISVVSGGTYALELDKMGLGRQRLWQFKKWHKS